MAMKSTTKSQLCISATYHKDDLITASVPGKPFLKLDDRDFTPMYVWHLREKEKKKQMTTEEKKALKEEKLKLEEKYMWAVVDGVKEKVGNFRVEPPGLFRGRGEHPNGNKVCQTKICAKAPPMKKFLCVDINRSRYKRQCFCHSHCVGGSGMDMRSTARMVPTLVKLLQPLRDHTTAMWELTNRLEGTLLFLTTRNVCMPELTPVWINGEVMAGQLESHVCPSVSLTCFGFYFALFYSGSNKYYQIYVAWFVPTTR